MDKRLETFNLIDPRLNALKRGQDKLEWAVPQGSAYTNRTAQKANSYSSSGMAWNFNSQGQNVLIDRRFYVKCQWQVTLSGVARAGGRLFQANASAPRDYPLTHIAENVSLTINGSSVSCNYADALQAFKRYNTDWDLTQYDLTGCPTMLDKFALYGNAMGSNRNSLASYQASGAEQGRGAFYLDSVTGNSVGDGVATQTVVIKYTTVEPLFLSPLLYSSRDLQAGLLGVNNIGLNINFSGNLNRIWSHYGSGLSAGAVSVVATIGNGATAVPELLVEYLNVPAIDGGEIPKSVLYDYTRVETYSNNLSTTLASGSSATYTNNAIQTSVCPKKIYVCVTSPRGDKTPDNTDTFLSITGLSLQYLNVAGQFSSMNENDIFNLSVKNGCKMSFQEFSGRASQGSGDGTGFVGLVGSVLCIDSTDLALPSNISSGCLVNSQLQFQITVANRSGESRAVNIYTVVCNEGVFEIAEGSANSQVGIVTPEEIVRTRRDGRDEDRHRHNASLTGAGLWEDFKSVVSKVPEAVGVAKDVYDSGKKVAKLVSGKGLVGGKAMSKQELKSLLQ
tara:strand:- start:467 stop:2155 length:1689 start_codon:yes stop_codon:yes gene_type:complete